MHNVSQTAPISTDWNQTRSGDHLKDKLAFILDLLDQPKIDVAAIKANLSEYDTLARKSGVDSQKGCEQILKNLEKQMGHLALDFPKRFGSDDVVFEQQKSLDTILRVITVVRGYQTSKLALDLMTVIIALRRFEGKIFLWKHIHTAILADKLQCPTDPKMLSEEFKASIAKMNRLNHKLVQIGLDLTYSEYMTVR